MTETVTIFVVVSLEDPHPAHIGRHCLRGVRARRREADMRLQTMMAARLCSCRRLRMQWEIEADPLAYALRVSPSTSATNSQWM